MKVAIAPILENMEYAGQGTIYFILANYYQKYPEYREYFLKHKSEKFTMVDNGAYEFGKPLPIKELLEIYNEVGANELILPDVEYDWEQTKELSINAIRELEEIYDYSDARERTKAPNLQYVLQGTDYHEMKSNCDNFVHERELRFQKHKIRKFGIPLYKKNWRERIDAVKWLSLGTVNDFHLLGLHDPIELAYYLPKHRVISTDGGFAVKWGCYNLRWGTLAELPNDRKTFPNDITKLSSKDKANHIRYNIEVLHAFANRSTYVLNKVGGMEKNIYV